MFYKIQHDPDKVFFTSNTSLGHTNIVYGQSDWEDKNNCRRFDTVEEHDSILLDNINSTVEENDLLFILGNFSFHKPSVTYEYLRNINCKNICYVLGNHDTVIYENKKNCKQLVSDASHMFYIDVNGVRLALSHYPMINWYGQQKGCINLHANFQRGTNIIKIPNSFNVSVDNANFLMRSYRPLSLTEIEKIINI
jgi:calcineurin-like phosphoesterase family protein